MSEGNQAQSVSQALRELAAKVETWEETLADWPPVVAESVARALETAQEQHETKAGERWRTVAGRLLAEQDARAQEIQSQRQRLTALTEGLGRVSRAIEGAIAPWVLGWSRALWRVVARNGAVTTGVSLILVAGFWGTGPPATCRAELEACAAERTNCRQWWGVLTEAERSELQERLTTQAQETGQ